MAHNRDTIKALREFTESLESGDLSKYRITKVTIDESGNYVRRVLDPAERTSTPDEETQLEKPSSLQTQVGGDHYKKFAIEPAEFIIKNGIGFAEGNAIKYVCRHESKNGADDLLKAAHYCCMVLEMKYGVKAHVQRDDN